MPVKSHIVDPSTNLAAEVVNGEDRNALVVATRTLKTYQNRLRLLSNPEHGIDMNIDASASGTPEQVHNGIDAVLWTGSNINGVVDFNNAAQPHTGTYALDFSAWTNPGNVCQIAKGSDLSVGNYVSLTMWVYVAANWAVGDSVSVYGYDTGAASIVGTEVLLESYFSFLTTGVYQKITIPLTDMGLTGGTIDAIRIEYEAKSAAAVDFYLDVIQFEESGAPAEFKVEARKGTWYHIDKLMMTYADAYTGVLADATMPKIPYDGFFGVSALSTGLIYQRQQSGEIVTSYPIRQHLDMMNFSNAIVSGNGSDGVNSWVSIAANFPSAITIKYEELDHVSITVSEDLSGLLQLRFSVGGFEEVRNT